MRVLVTRPLPDKVLSALSAHADLTVRPDSTPLDVADCRAALQDYDAVLCTIGDAFVAEAFPSAPRCKLLANFGVGYNHIDMVAAQASGVAVTNTPGAVTDATADIAMTLIFMTCRRAGEGERMLRRGHWTGWSPMQMLGTHVTGKRLGIIGMGRIGQAVARRAHFGFDMQIGYHSRSAKQTAFPAEQFPDLPALMSWCDIAVVAVPGGADTRHLVSGEALEFLGPKGVLINVARGDVVSEAALIRALNTGTIAAAGLDVYEYEPEVPEALMQMENVTLLPHLGTAALEVREAMGMMAVDNIVAFAKGNALPNAV